MVSLKKNELKTSKSSLFFISSERVNVIADARIFFLIFLSCYPFYIIPPCCFLKCLSCIPQKYLPKSVHLVKRIT